MRPPPLLPKPLSLRDLAVAEGNKELPGLLLPPTPTFVRSAAAQAAMPGAGTKFFATLFCTLSPSLASPPHPAASDLDPPLQGRAGEPKKKHPVTQKLTEMKALQWTNSLLWKWALAASTRSASPGAMGLSEPAADAPASSSSSSWWRRRGWWPSMSGVTTMCAGRSCVDSIRVLLLCVRVGVGVKCLFPRREPTSSRFELRATFDEKRKEGARSKEKRVSPLLSFSPLCALPSSLRSSHRHGRRRRRRRRRPLHSTSREAGEATRAAIGARHSTRTTRARGLFHESPTSKTGGKGGNAIRDTLMTHTRHPTNPILNRAHFFRFFAA